MKIISKRSSLLIKDNTFSLVILPSDGKKKTMFLLLWLMAWSVSGLIIMVNYFTLTNEKSKTMIIIWLGFWAYFEFKILKVFLWKRFGKEKLWIKNGTLHYQQSVNEKGKIKEFDTNLVSDWRLITLEKTNFADQFNQTFWVKGGERIEFTCRGNTVKLGMQLSDEEATIILQEIKSFK